MCIRDRCYCLYAKGNYNFQAHKLAEIVICWREKIIIYLSTITSSIHVSSFFHVKTRKYCDSYISFFTRIQNEQLEITNIFSSLCMHTSQKGYTRFRLADRFASIWDNRRTGQVRGGGRSGQWPVGRTRRLVRKWMGHLRNTFYDNNNTLGEVPVCV